MTASSPSVFRTRFRPWMRWAGFILLLTLLLFLRMAAERGRLADMAEWSKQGELNDWGFGVLRASADGVQSRLHPGKRLPALPKLARGQEAAVVIFGSAIDPRFSRWQVRVTFRHVVWHDAVRVVKTQVVPPDEFRDGPQPTQFWWTVEEARAGIMVVAILVWAAGIALLLSIRGVRRQIAPVCFAAALAATSAAAMNWLTQWPHPLPGGRTWAIAGSAMALVAMIIWIPRGRRFGKGSCSACGYNLTGNESGICPECGVETPASRRQMRLAQHAPLADRLEYLVEMSDADAMQMSDAVQMRDE